MMELKPHDTHWIFDRTARSVKGFDATGKLIFQAEARNRTVNDAAPPSHRFGPCPPGDYVFGVPVHMETPPFGPWFIPIDGPAMAANGRSGIGWHSGGSGLPDPFAPQQGWRPTHGCWRSQNEDLIKGVQLVLGCQDRGGTCYVSVATFSASGADESAPVWDDAPDAPLADDE